MSVLVSVIVPTFRRPQALRNCLVALAGQTMASTDFEVVVVDDGSPAPADTVVNEFHDRLTVRTVRQENAGPAAARNLGAREARAPLVAFADDDCLPMPEWIERLVACERERPGALVGGSTFNGLPDDIFAATSQLIVDLVYDHFNADPDDAHFLASNNMLCRRDRLLALGGFDVGFRRAGAEDRDFCDRWRAAGFPIVWGPEARIEHRHPQTLAKFVELHYRYGRGAYLYQAKRRARGTGTMREDLGFHRTIPRRILGRHGGVRGCDRVVRTYGLLALWQMANAVGFLSQAFRRTLGTAADRQDRSGGS